MLDVKNIYKTFNAGTVNEKTALNGTSLHLAPGDFVTVEITECLDYDLIGNAIL